MLRAEESQRSQLSLELHDDTIQVLCALLLQFDRMIPLAEGAGQSEIVKRLQNSREILAGATARARKLMFTLHPDALEERGLRIAITACARETGEEVGADWTVDVPEARYPWALEELAYRIVREALTNVLEQLAREPVQRQDFRTGWRAFWRRSGRWARPPQFRR